VQTAHHAICAATLVRVPYADILVDPAVVGLNDQQVAAIDWREPV